MKINFENITMNKLQEYIGKTVYIVHPGCGNDSYWGTIDAIPPHLLCREINGIYVSKLGIEIITGESRYEGYDTKNYNMHSDEESANEELNRLLG